MSTRPEQPNNLPSPSPLNKEIATDFYCSYPDCHYKSKQVRNVSRHEKTHSPSALRGIPCHICSKIFGPLVSFFHHMSSQHPNNLICPFCQCPAQSLTEFKAHVLAHSFTPRKSVKKIPTVRPVFLCWDCTRTFTLKKNLQRHQKKKSCKQTSHDPTTEDFAGASSLDPKNFVAFKESSTSHSSRVRTRKVRRTFRCSTCFTSFTFKRNLQRHEKNFCKSNPLASSAQKIPVVIHNRNENSFENSKQTEGTSHGSSEQFSSSSHLDPKEVGSFKGRKTNSRQAKNAKVQREFRCSDCSRTFTLKKNMDRHHQKKSCKPNSVRKSGMRIQTTGTQGCTSQVTRAQIQLRHEINPGLQVLNEKKQDDEAQNGMKKVVGVHTTLFACQHCSFTTPRVHNLRQHHRVHTGERPFQCPNVGCSYKARWVQNLQKHQQNSCRGVQMGRVPIVKTEENLGSEIGCGNQTQDNTESSSTAFACMLCNFIGDSQLSAMKHSCQHKTVVILLNRIC